jgi:hypothetical protein
VEPESNHEVSLESAPKNRPAEVIKVAMPPSIGRQIVRMLLRLSVILLPLLSLGCYLIAQPGMRSNQPSAKTVDEARMWSHVVEMSGTFLPRDWTHPENLDRCADYIAGHFKNAGAAVEMQDFPIDNRNYRNVVARFGVGKKNKIIVGAHYDACGETPGADDNASGVAGLLELAELIGKDPPACEIELVAYTLEEPPFFGGPQMGSAFHANRAAKEKDRIIGVIVLEMIGYFSDERGSQKYPLPIMRAYYPGRGNFITVVGRWNQAGWIREVKAGMQGSTDLPVYSFRGPASLQGVDYSDHRNYWPHDIPAVMITNTAFYRNSAYHTEFDTADRLDYRRMGQVVIGVYEAITSAAHYR